MNIIETDKLTKRYGKARGILNLDLEVKEGEIFGFIGPNGAGKSTTIRTLLGLIEPTSGEATIFGKDITKYGPEIREEIGYLPSEVFYYDGMRARDLLEYSASFYKKPKRDMEIRINKLADQLDLDLNKKIDDLSYGNRKKVGIIQGLLHSPKLLILDEPTGGLDPLVQATFFDILREENKQGTTIVFSSHILSEVQKMCHRVAIIKEGQLVEVQSIEEMRRNSYVRIKLELAGPVDAKALKIGGVTNIQILHGGQVSFLYRGDINEVIRALGKLKLRHVFIEEPSLEEIFMHYYEKSSQKKAA